MATPSPLASLQTMLAHQSVGSTVVPCAPATSGAALSLIRQPTVIARTGLLRSSLYNGITAGTFPAPVPTGPRTVAWVESEVSSWIEARIAERNARFDKQVDRRASQTQDARGARA